MKTVCSSVVLVSLALAACSGSNSPDSVAQGDPAAATVSAQVAPTAGGSDAADNARARKSAREFGDAATLLGADPIATIRGRAETCLSGDKKAFASFYAPELVTALTNSKILDIDYGRECGDIAASQSRPDLDAKFNAAKVFAKRTELL